MATVTVYPTADGFLNNISGYYGAESFNLSRSTSSSDGDYAEAYTKFTTVGAGIGAGDTINSATFWWNIYTWTDPMAVAYWGVFADVNNVWDAAGTWDDSTQPYVASGIAYGTTFAGNVTLGSTGWNSIALPTTIPKSNIFGVGIKAQLGDVGPATMYFYDKDGGANKPYVVIDYTPAPTTKGGTLTMMGVG